jgi:hypothetical protein
MARPDRWIRRYFRPNPTLPTRISTAPNETPAPTPASFQSNPDGELEALITVTGGVAEFLWMTE